MLLLHAASAGRVTNVAYSWPGGVYVRYDTKKRSNFLESPLDELRRIPLPRTLVNKGERMSCWENTGRDEGWPR
jgi:hypothetical protein